MASEQMLADMLGIDPPELMVIDTETTGFKADDRILQFSAVDGAGRTIGNAYFRPEGKDAWPDAMAVNGISPAKVAGHPFFKDAGARIQQVMRRMKAVVGWHLDYDLRMMRQSGAVAPDGPVYIDLMVPYSDMVKEPNPGRGGFKWQKLEHAARDYRFNPGNARMHNALTDVLATLHVLCGMLRDPRFHPPFAQEWSSLLCRGGNTREKAPCRLMQGCAGGPKPGF